MDYRFSKRLGRVQPSATLAISQRAGELTAQGIHIIDFGAGQPDFNTPQPIIEAAKKALDEGKTKYAPVAGLQGLRAAIASHYVARHGLDVSAQNVMVSTGGKQVLYNLAMTLLDPGDKVLIPSPYWVSYPEQVVVADGEPVFVETKEADDFALTASALAQALETHRPRMVILNSPSNPTGSGYSPETLSALLNVLRSYPDTWLIWDSIYEELIYENFEYVEPAVIAPDLADRIAMVSGFSKTYSMTGWRLGWAVAPPALIKAMCNLQGHSTSGATTFAQFGALAALQLPASEVASMVSIFDARRRRMLELLKDIPGVTCVTPVGAFYSFPNLSSYLGKKSPEGTVMSDDVVLGSFLLDHGRIAVVPGSAFGAPGFARLSYALSMDDMEEGLARLKRALSLLI